jgi:hypothetical protein
MEAICFSETSVDTQRTTRRHIPDEEDNCIDSFRLIPILLTYGLFFDPEDGGDMFLRNVGGHSTDYMAICVLRRAAFG